MPISTMVSFLTLTNPFVLCFHAFVIAGPKGQPLAFTAIPEILVPQFKNMSKIQKNSKKLKKF
jgi:hypothetical protein